MCLEDAILFLEGYRKRENDQMVHTREITYMVYCTATDDKGRENIFEFMPLEGDPSKEEIKKAKASKHKKRVERQEDLVKRLVEQGVIKLPVKKKENG